MTKEDIQEAIEEWQKRLNLKHWTVEISDEIPKDINALAETHPVEGRYFATIRFDKEFYDCTPKEKSNTIVHELIHLPQNRLMQTLSYLTRNTSEDTKRAINDLIDLESEFITDWLAGILSDAFPIPKSLM